MSNPADTKPSTALTTTTSALSMPAEGTPERASFRQAAADMTDVLAMAEVNPRAIVLWHGIERNVSDLVRAWRKLAFQAEQTRFAARSK